LAPLKFPTLSKNLKFLKVLILSYIYFSAEIINILELDPAHDDGVGMEQYSELVSKAEETLLRTEDEASIRNSVSQWQQRKCTKMYADLF
jgi:hypothetical protein